MFHNDTENEYHIYHDLNDSEIIGAIAQIPNHILITSGEIYISKTKLYLRFVKVVNFLFRILKLKKRIIVEDDFSHYCRQQKIQIIHCPYPILPETSSVKIVSTLHDVQEIYLPEFFSAEERAQRATAYLKLLRRSSMVIVSYDHIKRDLIKYFNVPSENINTILLKMDKLWFQKYDDKDLINLPPNLESKKYVLYPANAWQHKNHLRLLEAVAFLRNKENVLIHLVCTGNFDSLHGRNVIAKCDELGISNQVSFLGVVEETMLFTLYKKATAVVIPTLYEAGSFPLMESMFLNVPVICSNITSLPDTIGDNEFVFDPNDVTSIAAKLIKITSDEEFRQRSIFNSKIQRDRLKTTNPLELIKETYANAMNKN
jgi:glycosyltransferase involved in cell wall biosynthesis